MGGVMARWRNIARAAFLVLVVLTGLSCARHPSAETVALSAEEKEWLKGHPVIRLAPDPEFAPIEYFDAKGEYRGAAADIIRILEKRLGVSITVVRLKNWDEAMEKFRRREVDLLGAMVRTAAREEFARFSDTLVTVAGGIFTRSGTAGSLTLKDLAGKKVAVVSSYAAQEIIKSRYPGIDLVVVPDVASGLAKVSMGEVDAYVENMANVTYYAQRGGIGNLRLAGRTDFDYQWGIGIRKDWPELQGILNKGLASIGAEEREEAVSRWIRIERGWHPGKAFIAGAVAVLFGALLLVVAYWNYLLQKVVASRTASLACELEERERTETALTELTGRLEELIAERTSELEREVAERKRSEEAAVASEKRFRQLFEDIADAIYISDFSGNILAANEQASRELGYSREELLAVKVHELDAVYHNPERLGEQFGSYRGDAPLTFESAHRRKDGSCFPVEINARLVDYNGVPCVMGVVRNIAERKKGEEERLKIEKELQHAQKLESLAVLAGGIAHDFNNILTAIIGNADLAGMRLPPQSPARENLKRIEASAARAADLARQMLAYSGKGRFLIEKVDLNRLFEEMLPVLELSAAKKAAVTFKPARPIPLVEADAGQLRQVAVNLVQNAAEAVRDEDGVITVSTGSMYCDRAYLDGNGFERTLPEGLYLHLEVSDNGCGMDRDTVARIFDPFYTTKFTGRGLGMAAVLGIVRGHRGGIAIESEPGKGSRVRVLLPGAEAVVGEEVAADAARWRGHGKVLLVDDEESVRGIAEEMLRELGFEVVTAVDGRDALEIYGRTPGLSFVVLDLTMPHLDGEQTFQELIRIDPGVKVFLSSGYTEQEVSRRFAGKGPAGFIQKPYSLASLRSVLRNLCGKAAGDAPASP